MSHVTIHLVVVLVGATLFKKLKASSFLIGVNFGRIVLQV